jgi:hypothetical protein
MPRNIVSTLSKLSISRAGDAEGADASVSFGRFVSQCLGLRLPVARRRFSSSTRGTLLSAEILSSFQLIETGRPGSVREFANR